MQVMDYNSLPKRRSRLKTAAAWLMSVILIGIAFIVVLGWWVKINWDGQVRISFPRVAGAAEREVAKSAFLLIYLLSFESRTLDDNQTPKNCIDYEGLIRVI